MRYIFYLFLFLLYIFVQKKNYINERHQLNQATNLNFFFIILLLNLVILFLFSQDFIDTVFFLLSLMFNSIKRIIYYLIKRKNVIYFHSVFLFESKTTNGRVQLLQYRWRQWYRFQLIFFGRVFYSDYFLIIFFFSSLILTFFSKRPKLWFSIF